MSSKRKTRASQRNGAKSHGAVTPEGRLKSSANSARHHLLSKTILLDNERPQLFADLIAGLTREFNPQTETQRALVENMATSRWRQIRIWEIERAALQSAMEAHDPDKLEPATHVALAFRSLADNTRTLDLLGRYESRFDRQFARSLNLLMKLASPDNPFSRTGHACGSVPDLPACGTPAPHPGGTPVPHPGTSAEGAPLPAQNDFCQTNLIPFPDTSGAGLPACASAEGASLALTQPSPEAVEVLDQLDTHSPAEPLISTPATAAPDTPIFSPAPNPQTPTEPPLQAPSDRRFDFRPVSGTFFSSLYDKKNRPHH